MNNNMKNGNNDSIRLAASLLIGAAIGLMISGALLCASAAAFVKLRQVPTDAAVVLAGTINTVGAFCAGYIAVKLFGRRGMLTGAIAGVLMMCVVCVSGGIMGELDTKAAAVRAGICVAAAAIGGIMRVNKR